MSLDYNLEFSRRLRNAFESLGLYRPAKQGVYEPLTELTYNFEPLDSNQKTKVKLVIEGFVGGGFAGQVYKVKILEIENQQICPDLSAGKICAIKILVPPGTFSRLFRNLLYWIGFCAPFQLQVNPAAVKAGSLWQKFIRRAAKIKFGSDNAVVDIFGTIIDEKIGSCGEIRQWIEGRTWRLEVDDHIDLLKKWRKGKKVNAEKLGSPEYREKYVFMHEFVKLLHKIGAFEFARQYEWTTCKSQPNSLKRLDGNELTAVDFRAGLALLPFLPMSPGDFKLIFQGIKRGSLVQFDRGDLIKLKNFIDHHPRDFEDMQQMFDELVRSEDIYRNSIPDITHNHIRLLYSGKLWSTIFDGTAIGWKIKNIVDDKGFEKLQKSRLKTFVFFVLGLLPVLGGIWRKFWCNEIWRKHYAAIFSSREYFKKAVKGKIIELIEKWFKTGRISQRKAEKFLQQPWRILYHLPFLILIFPVLHRLLTDWQVAKEKIYFYTVRPFKLYFNAQLRKQWLLDMVRQGQHKHILAGDDADAILKQIDEPFIDKYLKSLAVHICCLPVTQIVSMIVAAVYIIKHPDLSLKQCIAAAAAIMLIFHIIPISPGSIARGIYVVYLVIKDRSFKDYNIAVILAFFKIVGYLAFPIQMTYRYPALARFMAAHWATDAVHFFPVFGERGALLEHGVFCLFYNWPLTIRRRMRSREALREKSLPRWWHIIPTAFLLSICLVYFGRYHFKLSALLLSLVCGMITTVYCGKAGLLKRFSLAALTGVIMAFFYTLFTQNIAISALWHLFAFAMISVIGAILTELSLPDVENHTG